MWKRRPRNRLTLAAALLVASGLLLLAESVDAQAFGRIKFVVTTPDGEPVQGVKLTVTCRERGNYREELETNKKGEAIVSVVDATKRYQVRVEAEGYPTVEDEVEPRIRGTVTREVVLAAQAPPPPSAQLARLTPAEESFNAGVQAVEADDLATAKAKFLESIELDADLAPPHLALATLYVEEGDHEAALDHATRLLELDPENTRGYRILYEAHAALGNQEEAKRAADVLSRLGGGDSAAVVYNEGVEALRVGDADTAKANFQQALEMQGDLAPAMSALAIVHLQEGSYAAAAEMAERYLAQEGEDPRMLRVRWDAYRGLGDAAKEKEAFDALAAADPKVLAKDLFDAGAQLFENGDVEAAREKFEKVLAIDPEHSRAHFQLGLCLVNTDDKAGAREHFEKFLELAPDDPEAETARQMLAYLEEP